MQVLEDAGAFAGRHLERAEAGGLDIGQNGSGERDRHDVQRGHGGVMAAGDRQRSIECMPRKVREIDRAQDALYSYHGWPRCSQCADASRSGHHGDAVVDDSHARTPPRRALSLVALHPGADAAGERHAVTVGVDVNAARVDVGVAVQRLDDALLHVSRRDRRMERNLVEDAFDAAQVFTARSAAIF